MILVSEVVYIGHDNPIDVKLMSDGSAVDLSSVTRVDLVRTDCGEGTISSVAHPTWFDWVTSGTSGILRITLKDHVITDGTYYYWVKVFDPTNSDGIVWGQIKIVFIDTGCPAVP